MKQLITGFFLIIGSLSGECSTGQGTKTIHQNYDQIEAWGMESCIDVKNCHPDLIRSSDSIKEYVSKLCDLIEMNAYGETVVVHFGEDEEVEGYSMTQLIETSLISGHFANKTNNIYINVFSCKKYDPYIAAEFTKDFFCGDEYDLHIVLRK